jgi:pyruvate ferredoxin oxidoreductase alpha subunit
VALRLEHPARRLLTGAEAVAEAMRQIEPDVVPVYPITPQTPIVETFASYVAGGRVATELLNVESEHSAMSAAVGAALAGARTMTATSSQGLALMVEVLYIAAGLRAPVVVAVGNRALSAPINIHGDHSDSMLARDSGAVQIFVENAQEAYDFTVMAPRIAEHPSVLLPVLVCQDGFTVTHSAEPVAPLTDDAARAFVGEYAVPHALLDLRRVTTHGPFVMPDYYFEFKYQQVEAMAAALEVVAEVACEYARLSGREYGLAEPYALEDAERAVILLGSSAGTVKDVVDELRAAGERVGLLEVRAFRPFPHREVRRALSGVPAVAVLDRAVSPGGRPPLFAETAAALHAAPAALASYVYGLGGRDLYPEAIHGVFEELACGPADETRYVGVRT